MLTRIVGAFAGRRRDAELNEELRAHIEMLADEHQRRGLSREAARAAALREFGGVTQITEAYREQRGLPFVDTLAQDVRYALRMWRRAPGFNVVVILVLALGIGANSAMFSVVNVMLFRPLPGHAAELVGVYSHDPSRPNSYRAFSFPNYADVRDHADVFDGVLAHTFALVGVAQGDVTRRTFVEVVSANFFSAIGVRLASGRTFTAAEERPGANLPVAIVGYQRWKDAGLSPAFLGSTVRINSRDFTIVGVAPPGFTGTTALLAPDMWLPLGVFDGVVNDIFRTGAGTLAERATPALNVAGRLKAGVSLAAANARLEVLGAQLARAYPAENRGQVLSASRLSRVNISTSPSDDTGPAVLSAVLMPLSGAVLLIACLNVTNMFLARGTFRKKEIAIRIAVGGGRRRIIRQLLTESVLLAAVGGAVALLFSTGAMRVLVASLTPVLSMSVQFDPSPDANVLAATMAFAMLSTIVFGLAPALKLSRPDVVSDLKDTGTDRRRSERRFGVRAWLVIGQVAISLTLMIAGGLFARGAIAASAGHPAYSYDRLLLVSIDPSLAGFDEARARTLVQSVLARIRTLPAVEAAGTASQVPFGQFHEGHAVLRAGQADGRDARDATYTAVSAEYFKSLGLPVLRGRDFNAVEESSASVPRVAVVDEPLARALFGADNPIGQQIVLPRREGDTPAYGLGASATVVDAPLQIVGLVPGIRDDLFQREPVPHLYVPSGIRYRATTHIHVRRSPNGSSDAQLLDLIRRELNAVDSRLPIVELTTMSGFHERGLLLWVIRAAGRTLTAFGALALLLAAVGVYGVMSYLASRRTHEFGVRLALGATRGEILWLVFRAGVRTTSVGLAIGFPLALALAMLLRSAIYGISPWDPAVMLGAPAVLVAAAALATYLPARRATRVTPLDALRAE
jgi:predicted permease